jgi:hypothetical protein
MRTHSPPHHHYPCEATEWITRHNRGYHLGHQKTVYGLKDVNRAFYNLLKKTILSFTSTEEIKFENGGWTVDNSPYITQAKEKFDQYPRTTLPNIPMPTDWHVMSSDWDDYTLDMKLLKHDLCIIGVLIWTVSTLRFDVAYHISVLAQYMTRPTEKLVQVTYRVMVYLVGTPPFNI